MKVLRINKINGIYDELYRPISYSFDDKITIIDSMLDLNQFFWNYILSEKTINWLLKIARSDISNEIFSPKFFSAIENEKIFVKNINDAKIGICDQNISPKLFFRYLETLEILCSLYSKFIFNEIPFNINEGFIINENSSKQLYIDCTNKFKNPLYDWIKEKIMPILNEYNPSIIFFDGKPSIFSFCIAKLIKFSNPTTHLCITNTDSEYYSMFKIKKYLIMNNYLFKAFDSVILKDFSETEQNLIRTLSKETPLNAINNLIFCENTNIISTFITNSPKLELMINKNSSQNQVVNIHLLPSVKCYWNKCTFCGINKKYTFENQKNDTILYNNLSKLKDFVLQNNIKYIWFIDEAIPVEVLKQIADYFIIEKINVLWQARCRIEKNLIINDLPKLLYDSGLRELRLGLESASSKVLKLMNKFPEDFNLNLVDKILNEYHNNGISIHFPMIIGFPGETKEDRRITYDYLEKIKQKYANITFNLNVLYVDISSKLFESWDTYDIEDMNLPCPPSEFLGNVAFTSTINTIKLQNEQDNIMRNILYPWYPQNALLKPHNYS